MSRAPDCMLRCVPVHRASQGKQDLGRTQAGPHPTTEPQHHWLYSPAITPQSPACQRIHEVYFCCGGRKTKAYVHKRKKKSQLYFLSPRSGPTAGLLTYPAQAPTVTYSPAHACEPAGCGARPLRPLQPCSDFLLGVLSTSL